MTKLKYLTYASMMLLLSGTLAMSQNRGGPDEACGTAGGCASCGACGAAPVVIIVFILAVIVLNIALLIWVARDSKSRGMDNSVMWMLLVMFTGVLGLIIYIFSRPQGELVQCPNCKNNRMQASAKCPHCGNT
jgi:uncharacterized membrane protein YhaH (DUF805 family)